VLVTLDELEVQLRAVLAGRHDVRFAILFGSSVARTPDAARDVDVAVSLDASLSLMDLGALAVQLEAAVGKSVDVVDVDEATTLLRWEIVRLGRTLVARDEDALLDFRARVPLEYADLKPYLDREAAGLRRVLGVT
jgi:predicted nucleotidyltransferase